MKKIGFIIGGMTRGGAERVISILANQYAQNGDSVYIVLLLENSLQYKLSDSIHIVDLTRKDKKRVFNILFWIKGIRKFLIQVHPDVVVSFVARINILAIISSMFIKTRLIISERNDPMKDGRSKLTVFLTQMLYPFADKIVFQTKHAAECFNHRIQKKGTIIANPISVTAEASSNKSKRIVSAGRLSKQKNQKLLIKAFSIVAKKYKDYSLWIYGDGELREKLTDYIHELGMDDKIFLPGNVEDIHGNIKDASIFVLSSNYEGLSNALLEAMMMGLPCITTDVAGVNEYIMDGYNGFITPVNSVKELVKKVKVLLDDESKRVIFGKRAKLSVEKCKQELIIKQWNQVLYGVD